MGALNHILAGSRIWLARVEHTTTGIVALAEEAALAGDAGLRQEPANSP